MDCITKLLLQGQYIKIKQIVFYQIYINISNLLMTENEQNKRQLFLNVNLANSSILNFKLQNCYEHSRHIIFNMLYLYAG